MASDPWFSRHRNQWIMRYRPEPDGPWVVVGLGKHPTPVTAGRLPKKPPIEVQDRAREFAEIEYRAAHGLGAAPARAKPVEGYVAAYLERYAAGRDAGSVRQARRHAASFLAFLRERGRKTVQSVTRADCRDYLEARRAVVSPATAQTEKGYLAPIWTRAVQDGLMAASPWSGVKVPGKKIAPVPTFWSPAEVEAIAAACRRGWQADLVRVLGGTGLRISAGLALAWGWIDWSAGVVRVPPEADKGGVGYRHTLGPAARAVLERRHMASRADLAFPHWSHGGPIRYDTAQRAIAAAIRRAKVPPGTAHDLRHSYARSLERAGVPMSVIQKQLGHKTPTMTFLYTAAGDDEAARWVNPPGGDGPGTPP